jgi:Phycobilisome protein
MLTQLSRLALESDGRYATPEELQFLKDYLQTATQRAEAYKAIRDNEAFLLEDLHSQVKTADGSSLYKGTQEVSNFFKRDQKHILRVASAAMLFNDLDFLREGLLLWHRTIVKAFGVERPAAVACQVWPGVMGKYLSADEYKFMSPLVGLIRAILG